VERPTWSLHYSPGSYRRALVSENGPAWPFFVPERPYYSIISTTGTRAERDYAGSEPAPVHLCARGARGQTPPPDLPRLNHGAHPIVHLADVGPLPAAPLEVLLDALDPSHLLENQTAGRRVVPVRIMAFCESFEC